MIVRALRGATGDPSLKLPSERRDGCPLSVFSGAASIRLRGGSAKQDDKNVSLNLGPDCWYFNSQRATSSVFSEPNHTYLGAYARVFDRFYMSILKN